uniref:Magnesium transporter n=1 Tax=Chrysotila carterae TaxID=13221 RepID=A0A7S4F6L0_CHRCT
MAGSSADAALGVGLALISQVSQVGKGLQKEGVADLPELSVHTFEQYVHSRRWMLGIVLDIAGAVVGLVSLALLPISVAQPIFCNGLVVLALFSACYLKERLGWHEWGAVLFCVVGTTLLALTLEPTDYVGMDLLWVQAKMGGVLLCAVLAILALELLGQRARESQSAPLLELVTGMQAGICIGSGNAGLGCGLQLLRVGEGFTLVIAVSLMLVGLAFTSAHPIFANRGYKVGRVVIITAYLSLVSLATGVFMGHFVLGEPWPSEARASAMRVAGLVTIAASIFVLNGSEMCDFRSHKVFRKCAELV